MKKILLFLVLTLAAQAYSQKSKECVILFSGDTICFDKVKSDGNGKFSKVVGKTGGKETVLPPDSVRFILADSVKYFWTKYGKGEVVIENKDYVLVSVYMDLHPNQVPHHDYFFYDKNNVLQEEMNKYKPIS